jgi:DNA-directed RNA polymerase specialized sigma24 family protein
MRAAAPGRIWPTRWRPRRSRARSIDRAARQLAIASNLLRRHWRAERRRLEAWARAQAGRPVTEAVPDGIASELVAALDALPVADREALLLYARHRRDAG